MNYGFTRFKFLWLFWGLIRKLFEIVSDDKSECGSMWWRITLNRHSFGVHLFNNHIGYLQTDTRPNGVLGNSYELRTP